MLHLINVLFLHGKLKKNPWIVRLQFSLKLINITAVQEMYHFTLFNILDILRDWEKRIYT